MNSPHSSLHRLEFLFALLFLTMASVSHAATVTWNGNGTSDNWSDSANWTASPVANDLLVFRGTNRLSSVNNLTADTQFNAITVSGASGAFTLQGNRITLNGAVTNNNTLSNLLTIDFDMILANDTNFNMSVGRDVTVSGDLSGNSAAVNAGGGILTLSGTNVLGGQIRATGATTTIKVTGKTTTRGLTVGTGIIDIASGGVLEINSSTNSTGANAHVITGAGTLIKAGTNTQSMSGSGTGFNGNISLQGGTLSLTTANAIGTSTITFAGGTLAFGAAGVYTTGNLAGSAGTVSLTSSSTVTLAGTQNTSFGGVIASTGGLIKSGTATQTLTGSNSYTGATTVNAGTLLVSGTGTINSTSGVAVTGGVFNYNNQTTALSRNVTVNGGAFRQNSAQNYTGALTFTSGTLGGSNLSGQSLTIGANQVIAPGNSTGTLSSGAETWGTFGTYIWEINNATGTAGSTTEGWDLLSIGGSLTLSATSTDKFTINVVSLTALQVAGSAQNFDGNGSYQWLIADSTSAITTFNANNFAINTSGFVNPAIGQWAVVRGDSAGIGGDSSQIYLTYVVPEPTVTALTGLGLVVGIVFWGRRRVCQ